MGQKVLCYDLGGTKLAVGVLNTAGSILENSVELTAFSGGKYAVLSQITRLGRVYLKKYPEIFAIGIASAGPLDPYQGLLLNPTNFGQWGTVPLAEEIKKTLHRPVFLENDAAAAALAEQWIGAAQGIKNAVILTLGTGLGVGIISNGILVRAGNGLHTEAGHMIIHYLDKTLQCGCGHYGCAETYLSGTGFTKRFCLQHQINISTQEIAERAHAQESLACKAFEEYAHILALVLLNYFRIFNPEIFILTGGFTNTHDLFLKQTQIFFKKFIQPFGVHELPIVISKLHNHAGLLGAAFTVLQRVNEHQQISSNAYQNYHNA